MLVRESVLCVAWKESYRFFRWDFRLPDITISQFYILLLIEPKIIKKRNIYSLVFSSLFISLSLHGLQDWWRLVQVDHFLVWVYDILRVSLINFFTNFFHFLLDRILCRIFFSIFRATARIFAVIFFLYVTPLEAWKKNGKKKMLLLNTLFQNISAPEFFIRTRGLTFGFVLAFHLLKSYWLSSWGVQWLSCH